MHSTKTKVLKQLVYEAADLLAIIAGLPNLTIDQKKQLYSPSFVSTNQSLLANMATGKEEKY